MTTNQKILRAVVVVGACSIVAKLVATGKELVVAAWFGRGDALDAFLIALVVPSLVINLIAGSFANALIPTYVQVREQEGHEAAEQLLSSIQTASLVFLTAVALVLAAGASYYMPLLGSGFSAAKIVMSRRLLYMLLPYTVLNGLTLVWSAVLNAGERFALPALIPSATPLIAATALLLFGRNLGVTALAVGTVVGTMLEVFLLKAALRARGVRADWGWFGLTPQFRTVLRQCWPMMTGNLLVSTSPIIDQSMAAMLSAGSVAALSYGNKITSVASLLVAVSLSTAVLPYFSQMAARQDWDGCRHTLRTYCLLILAVAVPVSGLLIAGSHTLVRLLYQRGAFTAADTAVVGTVQALFAVAIPFYGWSSLFVKFVTSLNRSNLLAWAAVINAGLNVVLNLLFMRWLGVAGIALSTSVACTAACAFLGICSFYLLRERGAWTPAS